MKDFPVIISFYTLDTPYQIEVQNLIASCEKYGLETSIEGVESMGSWELNCAYKPYYILRKVLDEKRPVLWVDADGVFQREPSCEDWLSSDLAVRTEPDVSDTHPSKVISSTVYCNPTQKGIDLVISWAKTSQNQLLDPMRQGEFWDQTALRDAILDNPMEAKVASLPLSYAKIFDHPGDLAAVKDPVIEHYQASRRYKKLIER